MIAAEGVGRSQQSRFYRLLLPETALGVTTSLRQIGIMNLWLADVVDGRAKLGNGKRNEMLFKVYACSRPWIGFTASTPDHADTHAHA